MNKRKYLNLFSALYVTAIIASIATIYQTDTVMGVTVSSSLYIFPISYLIGDIVAELYGYKNAKATVWLGILCEILFVILVNTTVLIHGQYSQEDFFYKHYYIWLARAAASNIIPMMISELINVYLISRWKLWTQGKYFWLRSIGSTSCSTAIYLIIAAFIGFSGTLDSYSIFKLIIVSYIFKILCAVILSFIGSIIVFYLKEKGVGAQNEVTININPFKKQE